MSVSYYLYTEGLIQGKWKCINSYLPMGDSYHLIETYYSGSRTYFSAACNKLEELGYVITPADLSDTLQNKATDWGCLYAIEVAAMEKCIPRSQRYEHHGYVLKSDIFQLEAGELEAVYEWLNPCEYARLDNEVQKSYQYYEWNDEMGWYKYFLLLLERVRWQRDNWESLYSRGPKIQKLRLIFTIL